MSSGSVAKTFTCNPSDTFNPFNALDASCIPASSIFDESVEDALLSFSLQEANDKMQMKIE
jgi:hypothetical protein